MAKKDRGIVVSTLVGVAVLLLLFFLALAYFKPGAPDVPEPKVVTVHEHTTTEKQPIINNEHHVHPVERTHTEHTTQLPCKLPETGGPGK